MWLRGQGIEEEQIHGSTKKLSREYRESLHPDPAKKGKR
jgi:hypothetical protein